MHQSREKESLSLFGILSSRYLIGFETNALNVGLLDKTKSVLGKQTLKEWVSRPIRDKQVLENRHASISLFMASDMRDTTTTLRAHLGHIKNINRLLVRVRESKAKVSDWQYILKV
jgi:DNA mismatch repair ATPase MutS